MYEASELMCREYKEENQIKKKTKAAGAVPVARIKFSTTLPRRGSFQSFSER